MGIEPTNCRVYNRTLVSLRHDWPELATKNSFKLEYLNRQKEPNAKTLRFSLSDKVLRQCVFNGGTQRFNCDILDAIATMQLYYYSKTTLIYNDSGRSERHL